MLFEDLLRGLEYYNQHFRHWNSSYRNLRIKGDEYWLHLERLNESQIREQILHFLNDWLCRVDYDSAPSVKIVLDKSVPFYAELKDGALVTLDFDAIKNVGGRYLKSAEVIERIMRNFLEVRPKFGPVPASKLMHMAMPDLFLMWDSGIKKKYGIPSSNNSRWYVRFLKLMKLQINHAITDFMKANNIGKQEAIRKIKEKDDNLTFPRILDKYNFAIRDNKLEICNQCFEYWSNSFNTRVNNDT